jgi:energy-coupling factor transporter transmembrane protein EcfT
MIAIAQLEAAQSGSLLGRMSPLLKLGLAALWLVGFVATPRVGPPLALAAAASFAALVLGRVPAGSFLRGIAPLWTAALGIAFFTALFSAANRDPAAPIVLAIGALRITDGAVADGLLLGARVVAIAAISVAFARSTSPTALADALVQQARLPDRFAYGALAAYQAVPRLSLDLVALREARRLRGLRGDWHPRLLVALLVLAVRHADRLGLAMDARGFGRGPRSHFRPRRWEPLDLVMGLAGVALLGAVLALA